MFTGRDGHPADPESIYLTTGASGGVSNMLQVMIANPSCGVLIPIPQYPLYTAALALNEAVAVPYYLRENEKWSLDIPEMRQAIHKARSDGTDLRAVVIINPGNPTGQCLSLENMKEIVELAYDEKLALLADEVYQTNVFDKKRPFVSFKKVLKDLGEPYASNLELVSFHSMSKGQIGECGRRGGFYEMVNFDKQAAEQIYKLASIQLCSGLQGQIGIDLMIDPPKQGDESYEKYQEEVDTIQSSLRERSTKICEAFEKMEGVTCNPAEVGFAWLFRTLSSNSYLVHRAQCTFSRRLGYQRKPSRPPRPPKRDRMVSTAYNYWRRPASAWSPVQDLVRSRARYISVQRSWLRRQTNS